MHPRDAVVERLGLARVGEHTVRHVGERNVVLRVRRELPQVDRVRRVEYDATVEHRADPPGDRGGVAGWYQDVGVVAHESIVRHTRPLRQPCRLRIRNDDAGPALVEPAPRSSGSGQTMIQSMSAM